MRNRDGIRSHSLGFRPGCTPNPCPKPASGPTYSLNRSEPACPHLHGVCLTCITLTCVGGITQANENRQSRKARL